MSILEQLRKQKTTRGGTSGGSILSSLRASRGTSASESSQRTIARIQEQQKEQRRQEAEAKAAAFRQQAQDMTRPGAIAWDAAKSIGRGVLGFGKEIARMPVTVPLKVLQTAKEGFTGKPQVYTPETRAEKFLLGDEPRQSYTQDQRSIQKFAQEKGLGFKTSATLGALGAGAEAVTDVALPGVGRVVAEKFFPKSMKSIFSKIGKKAPVLEKAIDEGRIAEKEIEDIFEKQGIEGVEKVVEKQRTPLELKRGELAPKIKEIEAQTGKLKVKQINDAKAKLEKGYSANEIAEDILKPVKAQKLVSKAVKPKKQPKTKIEVEVPIKKQSPDLKRDIDKKDYSEILKRKIDDVGKPKKDEITVIQTGEGRFLDTQVDEALGRGINKDTKVFNVKKDSIELTGNTEKDLRGERLLKVEEAKAIKAEVKEAQVKPEITESNFAKRLNKDLPEGYKLDEQYEVAKMNDEAIKASELIKKNKQKAMRIANGVEKSDELTQTATNIELGEIAKRDGDWATVNQLFATRREAGTRRGQEIAMEKMSVLLNPQEKFMKDVVKARLGKVKVTSRELKEASKEIVKKQKVVKESVKKATKARVKLSQAQKLLDTLTC